MKHVSEAVPFFYISTILMMMTLAAIAATWGVYTINRLRREAFEARQLGQYRLRRLLGAGGMGEVYLAEHQLMKRPVAIKLIKPGKAADPQALARFHREVQATAKLTHWNSIEIFDYGHADDGTFYYVMEYLPGKSSGRAGRKARPDDSRARRLAAGASLRRLGRSPQPGPDPPRHQARQHFRRRARRHLRRRQAARFRPGEKNVRHRRHESHAWKARSPARRCSWPPNKPPATPSPTPAAISTHLAQWRTTCSPASRRSKAITP